MGCLKQQYQGEYPRHINDFYRCGKLLASIGFLLALVSVCFLLITADAQQVDSALQPYAVNTQPYVMDEPPEPLASETATDTGVAAVATEEAASSPESPPKPISELNDGTPLETVFAKQSPIVNQGLMVRMGLSFLVVMGLLGIFFKWVFPKLVAQHRHQQAMAFHKSQHQPSQSAASNPPERTTGQLLYNQPAVPPVPPSYAANQQRATPPDQMATTNAPPSTPSSGWMTGLFSGSESPKRFVRSQPNNQSTVAQLPSRTIPSYTGLPTEERPQPAVASSSAMASFGMGAVPSTVIKRFTIKKNYVAEFVAVWDRYFLVAATPQGSVLLAEATQQGNLWTFEPSQVPVNHPAASWLYQFPQLLDECLASLQPQQVPPNYAAEPTTGYGYQQQHDVIADKYLADASSTMGNQLPSQDAYWMQTAANNSGGYSSGEHQYSQPQQTTNYQQSFSSWQEQTHQELPENLQQRVQQQVQEELASVLGKYASTAQPLAGQNMPLEQSTIQSEPRYPQTQVGFESQQQPAPIQQDPQRFQPNIHSQTPVEKQQSGQETSYSALPSQAAPQSSSVQVEQASSAPSPQPTNQHNERYIVNAPVPLDDERPNNVPGFLGAPPSKLAVRRLKQIQQKDALLLEGTERNMPARSLSERASSMPDDVVGQFAQQQKVSKPARQSPLSGLFNRPLKEPLLDESFELMDDFDDTF